MVREYLGIIGTHIVREEDGEVLALLKDIIINPDTGKIEAFWVKPMNHPFSDAILLTDDIIEWKKHIYVKDEKAISSPGDIIRIEEILSRNSLFIGNRVRTKKGENIGFVYDLEFDDRKFYLKKLYTQKIFLIFRYDLRLFFYESIIEVLPEAIVVKDTVKKAEEKATAKEGKPVLDA